MMARGGQVCAAVVLCGGRSARMGQPKAWLPFGPERLLQRVVRILGGAVGGPVVVVAADGQELPDLADSVRVVRDHAPDQGPLQGLATGLRALPASVDLAWIAATDAPFLCPGWWERLSLRLAGADGAVPEVGGRLHPLAAAYRRGPVLAGAEGLLTVGRRRLVDLDTVVSIRTVAADDLAEVDPDLGTLVNLNTPDDYRRALDAAGFGDEGARSKGLGTGS